MRLILDRPTAAMCLEHRGPGASNSAHHHQHDSEKLWVEDAGHSVLVDRVDLLRMNTKTGARKQRPVVTLADVEATKVDPSKLWIILEGRVYDVKKFADQHPGGKGILVLNAGKDMTDAFAAVSFSVHFVPLLFLHFLSV